MYLKLHKSLLKNIKSNFSLKIQKVLGRQVLDSSGNPAVEAEIHT